MSYDKQLPDGRVIKAPPFTSKVLSSITVLFQIAEWLLVIVAFQFVAIHFGYLAAKVAWFVLAIAFGMYIGVLSSNLAWRAFENPFKSRGTRFVVNWLLPGLTTGLVFVLLKFVAEQMVAAQVGAA